MRLRLSKFTEVVDVYDTDINKYVSIVFNSSNEKVSFFERKYFLYLLRIADEGQLQESNLDSIKDFLVKYDADEFSEFITENSDTGLFLDTLRYTIMVSGNCNFNCCYCGQDHENVSLSYENADFICKETERKLKAKNIKKLKISWFGGEPLLSFDIISHVSTALQNICAEHDVEYIATITTNAYLLCKDKANALITNMRVKSFFLTIDGDKDNHDKRRCLKNNAGTFDIVYTNFVSLLDAAKKYDDVEIILRCNTDVRNGNAILDLIDRMARDGLQQFSNLSVVLAPIHDWGNNAGDYAFDKTAFANLEILAYTKLIQLGFHVRLLPKRRYGMCMFTDGDSEMVDPYGNVFPCSEVGLVNAYKVNGENKYRIGHISDQARKTRGDIFEKYDLNGDGMSSCRQCSIFPSCYGACPKQWQDGNVPCPSSKINLKQRLTLFYCTHKHRAGKLIS